MSGDDDLNGKNGKDNDDTSSKKGGRNNIVKLPSLAERDRMRRQREAQDKEAHQKAHKNLGGNGRPNPFMGQLNGGADRSSEHSNARRPVPFFNLPPITQYLAGSLVLAYILTSHVLGWINPFWQAWGFFQFSFIPGRFVGDVPLTFWAVFSPLTYMWLHGGVMHLVMNMVMLVALGTAVERWLGGTYLLISFLVCGLVGAGVHFVFYMHDYVPVIGASGATSGLFGLVMLLLQNQRRQYRGHGLWDRYGIWPFVAIWLAISIVPAFFTPSGQGYMVAWAVHIGGFLAGIGIYQFITSRNKG